MVKRTRIFLGNVASAVNKLMVSHFHQKCREKSSFNSNFKTQNSGHGSKVPKVAQLRPSIAHLKGNFQSNLNLTMIFLEYQCKTAKTSIKI